MAERFVERAVDGLSFGDQDDGPAAGFECGMDVAEGTEVILDVFDDVEADDGIELLLHPLEVRRIGRVHPLHLQRLAVGETVLEPLQMLTVDIGGDIALPSGDQLPGEIPHASADFQNAPADEGGDGLGHPPVEVRRIGEGIEDRLVGIGIDIRREGVPQNHPERLEGIFQADFLAFLVGAAVVADGGFVDLGLTLGELDGNFGFESEAVRPDGDALQQRSAEGLVAGLHVGKVQVGDHVAHGGEHPVGQRVPVVEHPAFPGGQEAGAEYGVGAAVEQRAE